MSEFLMGINWDAEKPLWKYVLNSEPGILQDKPKVLILGTDPKNKLANLVKDAKLGADIRIIEQDPRVYAIAKETANVIEGKFPKVIIPGFYPDLVLAKWLLDFVKENELTEFISEATRWSRFYASVALTRGGVMAERLQRRNIEFRSTKLGFGGTVFVFEKGRQ